jgi:hypothetical protein
MGYLLWLGSVVNKLVWEGDWFTNEKAPEQYFVQGLISLKSLDLLCSAKKRLTKSRLHLLLQGLFGLLLHRRKHGLLHSGI